MDDLNDLLDQIKAQVEQGHESNTEVGDSFIYSYETEGMEHEEKAGICEHCLKSTRITVYPNQSICMNCALK